MQLLVDNRSDVKKTIKIIKAAPTCFGSRRNYNQVCSSLMMVPARTETCWSGFCKFNWFLTIERFYTFECINWTIQHSILSCNSVLFRLTTKLLLLYHFNTQGVIPPRHVYVSKAHTQLDLLLQLMPFGYELNTRNLSLFNDIVSADWCRLPCATDTQIDEVQLQMWENK